MTEQQPGKRLHVAVIGAGIVGAATAVELSKAGHAVTIIEAGEPGGEQAASHGNGAWISPGSIIPMSTPGLWRRVPGFLADPLGPLTIRWRHLPRLAPWLIRFVRAGATVEKVEATARALRSLLKDAPTRHMSLARDAGVPGLIEQGGLMHIYPDRADYLADAFVWRLRRDNGVTWTEVDAAALRQREPRLAGRYTFGALIDDGAHCTDPGTYVAALVRHAVSLGARIIKAEALGFDIHDRRLKAVTTSAGSIACDRAVIAAGIGSKQLARMAGDRIPLESERGYHVVIANPEAGPRTPVMPSDGKMANTMTRAGLRASGQVELASVDAAPDWRRADILLKQLLATYPGLPREIAPDRVTRWMGHRPSTPDGLPVLGSSSACADIFHAFGHGHVGLAAGPASAALVAALIVGASPSIDPAPFAATRF